MKPIKLSDIDLDASPKVRAALNEDAIQDYAEIYRNKGRLPAITVFVECGHMLLADGRHRIAAAKLAGLTELPCDLRPGQFEACLKFALLANNESGVRPSAGDRRRAILSALEQWPEKTQTEIAELCGVTQGWVSVVRRRSLVETTGEPIIRHTVKNKSTVSDKQNLPMPAKLCRETPIIHVTPPPPPLALIKAGLRDHLENADRMLNHIMHRQDLPIDLMRELGRLCSEFQQVRAMLQPELPGLAVEAAPKPKARGTQAEVEAYCSALVLDVNGRQVRLTKTDGAWFYDKMIGCGWKNGGQPVADWQATVRTWTRAGYFPSQKTQPAPIPRAALAQPYETLQDINLRRVKKLNEELRKER